MCACVCMCVNMLSRLHKDGHDEMCVCMHTHDLGTDMHADKCVYSYNMFVGTCIYAFTCVCVVNYSVHNATCTQHL